GGFAVYPDGGRPVRPAGFHSGPGRADPGAAAYRAAGVATTAAGEPAQRLAEGAAERGRLRRRLAAASARFQCGINRSRVTASNTSMVSAWLAWRSSRMRAN